MFKVNNKDTGKTSMTSQISMMLICQLLDDDVVKQKSFSQLGDTIIMREVFLEKSRGECPSFRYVITYIRKTSFDNLHQIRPNAIITKQSTLK